MQEMIKIIYMVNIDQDDLFVVGSFSCSGIVYEVINDNWNFKNALNQYKLNLWGNNTFRFGIAIDTL